MKTILVVEDDDHLRRVFRTLLEGEGFSVIEAADGQEGVEAACAQAPACIVTDTMMPRLDGLGMLAQLKALGCSRPTLIVSAVHELPPLEELKAYGVEQVLGKPFAFDRFVAAVIKLVGRQDE